jgi:hypothetical protein
MPRFGIKSLMYLTALVAAYVLMLREALQSHTWAALVGYVVFASLVTYKIIPDIAASEKAHHARPNQAREDDRENPTT